MSEQSFHAAVALSEGVKQQELHNAIGTGAAYTSLVRKAEQDHWRRVVEAGRVHGVRSLNAEYALSQSLAGKTP
jgi:hypothetical protein